MAEEGTKSVFNAGVALAERIDSLQRAINSSRFNPLAYNPEISKYGYQIIHSACDSLLKECWGKMSDVEKKEGQRLKKLALEYTEHFPIMMITKEDTKINKANYKKFMQILDLYENKVKEYLEAHDLNSPNKDMDDDDEL